MASEGNTRESRAAVLLRNAADVVLEIALDGRILFVSEAVESILARSASSFVGGSFVEAVAPEDRPLVLAEFRKIVESGAEPRIVFHALRCDGHRIRFDASTRSYRGEDGERRIVAVARDVTEEATEASTLRRRDTFYRALVESGTRSSGVLSASGDLLFTSLPFRRQFGPDTAFREVLSRISERTRQSMETAWFASSQPDHDGSGAADVEYVQPDGRSDWLCFRWQRFQLEEGERAIAFSFENIDPRKQIEQALAELASSRDDEDPENVRTELSRLARALPVDRLALGRILPERPGRLSLVAVWQDGRWLEEAELEIADLPEAIVARGETCVYPSGLGSLLPATSDRFGSAFESFVGVPIRLPDGTTFGVASAYARRALADSEAIRSLLTAFSMRWAGRLERQRLLAEMRASQDRFESLGRAYRALLTEVDPEGVITYVSPVVEQLLGRAPESVIGRRIDEILEPAEPDPNVAPHEGSRFAASDPSIRTMRARHADGSERWLETRICSSSDAPGAERTLILSREVAEPGHSPLGASLFSRLVESSDDWIFVCEPDTLRLVFANGAARLRFSARLSLPDSGACPSESLERPCLLDLLPPHEASRLTDLVLPGISPSRAWSGELQLRAAVDDESIPTEATLQLLPGNDEGERSYLSVTLRDMGARRSAAEALRESELRLRRAQKMEAIGRLAGGIAHDFNNLLTAIIGYSDLVLDTLGQDHVAYPDVEEILRAAERAGGLTRQLLAFSRRQVLKSEPIDLNRVVSELDNMMRRLLGENVELVTALDGGLRQIVADRGQLEQVLVNLLVNARDAMPEGGRIQLETSPFETSHAIQIASGRLSPGDYVRLSVTDSGHGMDEATRDRIFEPFFTTKSMHEGTGLGLATVYGIVSQSGGQIDVESAPGAGATFSVYLPTSPEQSDAVSVAAPVGVSGGRETILLLEDARAVRRLVARTLERRGYRVLEAESATAALRHCARFEGEIDLLLCDVVVPKTSGPEVADRAASLRPGLRVLFMSGFSDETLLKQGLEPRQAQLLEKPFTPNALLARVRRILDDRPAESPLDSVAGTRKPANTNVPRGTNRSKSAI